MTYHGHMQSDRQGVHIGAPPVIVAPTPQHLPRRARRAVVVFQVLWVVGAVTLGLSFLMDWKTQYLLMNPGMCLAFCGNVGFSLLRSRRGSDPFGLKGLGLVLA